MCGVVKMGNVGGVILAAGKGERLVSRLPKPFHPLLGKPILFYPVRSMRSAGISDLVIVLSHAMVGMREDLDAANATNSTIVLQSKGRGTAAALDEAREACAPFNTIIVGYADTPLVTGSTVCELLRRHKTASHSMTILTASVREPEGLGRIVRDDKGNLCRIVEDSDTSDLEKNITEVNAGLYCFESDWLWNAMDSLGTGSLHERRLTDLLSLAAEDDKSGWLHATDPKEVQGINNRVELARAEVCLRDRVCRALMMRGVTIEDPNNTYVEEDVRIGRDTVILPGTRLMGGTVIGSECKIGPSAIITDSDIGDHVTIGGSHVEKSRLEENVSVGSYCYIRDGAVLRRGAHIGNCVEIKAGDIGRGVNVRHFSYIGDASLGSGVNFGAGAVTCNFDGTMKHYTTIKQGAFIGSGAMLVAPVEIGERAIVGAGAVVTRDVGEGDRVVGSPARSIIHRR